MQQGRTSSTALLVALSTVFLSRRPRERDLLPAGAAEQTETLLGAVAPGRTRLVGALSRPPLHHLVRLLERSLLPGIQRHYAARKRAIEEAARTAVAEGAEQLLVLGAGLDTLATRVARDLPHVRCVEVDHPATQAVKRRALGEGIPASLRLLPVDLSTRSLRDVDELDRGLRTVVVLEGVSMYLTEEAVRDILGACAQLPTGSQVLWTFVHPDDAGRLRFHRAGGWVDTWLDRQHEPFTWGLPVDAVPGFAAPLGLEVEEILDAADLRTRYLDPLGLEGDLAEGEAVCRCRTSP